MSTNWSPTRMTGLSTFIALWKTSETWRQRTRRSSSRLIATRSSPRKRMRPPETSAGGLRICSTALASVLLPQPDSPARPRISPGAIDERDVVDGAHAAVGQHVVDAEPVELSSVLRGHGAHLLRPCPKNRPVSIPRRCLRGFAQLRVADLVEAREDEDERDDRQRQRDAREHEWPPLALQHGRVDLGPVERDAPALGAEVAEAEELEAGGGQDGDVEDEHEGRRDAADHVRHQLEAARCARSARRRPWRPG